MFHNISQEKHSRCFYERLDFDDGKIVRLKNDVAGESYGKRMLRQASRVEVDRRITDGTVRIRSGNDWRF